MDSFFLLIGAILPLYALIALGYVAGKFFDVERQTLGALGIYILMPVVAFGFVGQLDFKLEYIALPVVLYIISVVSAFFWLKVGRAVYGDPRANLLSLCTSAGNTGYFGLPLVVALFSPEWVGLYIFAMMGGSVFEATVMYYIAARGKFDVKQSLLKLAKFPSLYAIGLGVAFNLSNMQMSDVFLTYWGYFKGAYIVIGMMIIGCALSRVKKLVIAPRFLSLTFLGKFVIFPCAALALILFDQSVTQYFTAEVYKLIYILAIVPTAANIAAFAVEMDLRPEKAASTILIGTLVALIYIPLALIFFDQFIAP